MKTIINFKSQTLLIIVLGVLINPIAAHAIQRSLNGQSGSTQLFSNDANVTITSVNNIHSLGWNGALPVSRGGTGAGAFSNGSILFSNGTSIAEDNTNLFWDDATNMLKVGADAIIHSLIVGLGGGSVDSNTALGKNVLLSNTTGYGNIALGMNALLSNTTGRGNVAVGGGALSANTFPGDNTAIGYLALTSNSGADQNTAVGSFAMTENLTGSANSALGMAALNHNTTGGGNTAVGLSALAGNTSGTNNVAMGFRSLGGNTTGSSNIAIGSGAGQFFSNYNNLTTPGGSIYIGAGTKGYDDNDLNSIVIGTEAIGAGSNKAVIGNSSVTDVYLGSSAGLANLHAANICAVSSGASVPSSIPTAIGQIYIDTSAAKVYISTGTSSSADWAIIN